MIRFIVSLVTATLVITTAAATASAEGSGPGNQPHSAVIPIMKYEKGINKPCPPQTVKYFSATLVVHNDSLGEFVDGDNGRGVIWLENGRKLVTSDNVVPPENRKAEFFWFVKRGAMVDKTKRNDRLKVELVGENMWFKQFRLQSDCIEMG